MSVLMRRSMLVLGLLFGLLFAVGTAVLWRLQVNVLWAIVFAAFVVGLQYLLGPWIIDRVLKIGWHRPEEIGPEFAAFLTESCRREGIPVPRFGIIEDGNPNAFTYGHTPSDSRVVVTRGLIDMLSEPEREAVVAHELGHIKHWDFVVMTVASLVPLILYILYTWTRKNRRDGMWVVALTSYAAYIISQYIVLFLSRIREYYADQYSSKVTGNPNALSTALVSIAYGLAKAREPEAVEVDDKKKKKTPDYNPAGAIASMGFFSASGASQFAMSSCDNTGNFSHENMRRAMQWDLVNPWAKWFELNSTHPLAAKRIAEIEKSASPAGQSSAYQIEADRSEGYSAEFVQDIGIALLPYVGVVVGLAVAFSRPHGAVHDLLRISSLGWVLLFGGLGSLIRTIFSYKSDFRPAEIVSLVGETKVSHIRPIPAEIKGTIIGRGEPGAFWSSDLVLQDQNGFITLL
ncbi:MAG TPA: zinc metalloprotease HtpX, partial [Armatimonadota bacterium]